MFLRNAWYIAAWADEVADKPLARRGQGGRSERHVFAGDRDAIRRAALVRALEMLKAEAA